MEGDRQQKWLIASMLGGCAWIFALLLVLALTHVVNPPMASARVGSMQQVQVRQAASVPSNVSGQPDSGQDPSTLIASDDSPEDQPPPPPTLLGRAADFVFGLKPDRPVEPWLRPQIEIDPSLTGVQVWTSKSSGYYYCVDSPFYMTVNPGSVMNQRDALQTGYQPILGRFCR